MASVAELKAQGDKWRSEEVEQAKSALAFRSKQLYQAEANNWDVAAMRAQQIYQMAVANSQQSPYSDQTPAEQAGLWKHQVVMGTNPPQFKGPGVRAGVYSQFALEARTRPARAGTVNPAQPGPQWTPPAPGFANEWGIPTTPGSDIGGAPELPAEKPGWSWPERIAAVAAVVTVVWGLNRWRS